MTQVIGLDVGYGYTKATNGARSALIQSIVGPAIEIKYHNGLISSGRGVELELEGRRQFVGELARLQSPVTVSPLARERDLGVVRSLMLAALAEISDHSSEIQLVTGLPIRWYDDAADLEAGIAGQYAYTVNGVARSANVAHVRVVPQPFGTLFLKLLTVNGILADRDDLAGRRVGIIDVGTYTTDYALSDELTYIEPRSGSNQSAMARVYELLRRGIQERYELDLPMHEVERAFHKRSVTLFGKTTRIDGLIDDAVAGVGDAILAGAESLWPDRARTFAAILVTGGGGPVFYDAIRAVYPHARLVENPQAANAEGFWRYGLFKARKSKAHN